MEVRLANLADAKKLRDLRLSLVKSYPGVYGVSFQTEAKKGLELTEAEIKEFSLPGAAIFVAEDDGKLVGMCRIGPTKIKGVAYAGRMGVLPAYLGKGVGRLLSKFRLDWARKNSQYGKVQANVRVANTRAVEFSQRMGFKIVSKGSYRGVPEYNLEMTVSG